MVPQSKAIAKKQETGISIARKAELQKLADKRTGLEGIDQSDIKLPRILVTQDLSQQFKDGLSKKGELWNDVLEVSCEQTEIIPLWVFKSRLKLVIGQGLKCRSDDSLVCSSGEHGVGHVCKSCVDSQWGDDGKPPLCSLAYNFVCIDIANKAPCTMTFIKSASNVARAWITKAQIAGKSMFAYRYKLSSKLTKATKGEFYAPTVTMNGECSMEELDLAVKCYEMLKGKRIVVDYEEGQEVATSEEPF